MRDIVNMLRGVEFFDGFADEQLARLATIAKLVEFPADRTIFHEHDLAKDVYFITSGRVSLVICASGIGCRQLMEVGPGELIGWSPLVGRFRLSDTAHTVTPTKAIAMEGERILALCNEDLKLGFDFMRRAAQTLSSRLSATRMQLLRSSGMSLPEVQVESD